MTPHQLTLATALCSLALLAPQFALAQRTPNLSMTPNEMINEGIQNQRPTTITGGRPAGAPSGVGGGIPYTPPASAGLPVTGAVPTLPSGNYMDGYCDPNFKPMLSRNAQYANMAACLEQQRLQACDLYRAMPADARQAVDASINCLAQGGSAGGGLIEAEDGTLQPAPATTATQDCNLADAQRLNLLRRYWEDQGIAYGIVFIPDLVMDNSGQCLRAR